MPRFLVGAAVAILGIAAAGGVVQPPAQAATCGSAAGVSVVVDFHQLGGGLQTFCDAGGAGKYAQTQFVDAGHKLTFVQRQPGFVCRVDGTPASDPCVNTPPADAYWSLWWSDGKSGTWTYSSTGVASLKVPAGGYVALSWQQGSAQAAPGVAPTAHASSPTTQPTTHPTRHPSQHPTQHPTQSPTSPSSSPPTSPAPVTSSSSTPVSAGSRPSSAGPGKHAPGTKAKATTARHPQAKASDTGSPSADPTDGVVPTEAGGPLDPTSGSSGGGGGLPGWVAPVAVLLLFGAAGTVVVVRRRGSGGV